MLPTFLVKTIHQPFSTGKSAKMKQLLFIGNKLPSPSSSCSPRIANLDHLMILRSQPPAQSELGGVVPLETLPNAPCHQCPGSHHSPSAPEKRNKGPHSPWIWHQKLSRKKMVQLSNKKHHFLPIRCIYLCVFVPLTTAMHYHPSTHLRMELHFFNQQLFFPAPGGCYKHVPRPNRHCLWSLNNSRRCLAAKLSSRSPSLMLKIPRVEAVLPAPKE